MSSPVASPSGGGEQSEIEMRCAYILCMNTVKCIITSVLLAGLACLLFGLPLT